MNLKAKIKIAIIDKGGYIRPKDNRGATTEEGWRDVLGSTSTCPCKTDSLCSVPRTYPKELGVSVIPGLLKRNGGWRPEKLIASLVWSMSLGGNSETAPVSTGKRRELPSASCHLPLPCGLWQACTPALTHTAHTQTYTHNNE